jgi:gamma-glutamylcyclotransferase (GGCT)/AIG2-like uncharacterized protein YtfP
MHTHINKLFVYGSLRKGFHHSAYQYISKHFTFVSDAKVKGRLYDLGDYPAAVPTSEEFYIKGELYEIKSHGEFEWAIEQLDDYEGLNPEEGEKQAYVRQLTDVFYNDHSTRAWIYWYNDDVTGRPIIPSGDVFDYLTYKNK